MNFTVSTTGRQFDRLGIMYLGGVEVFRTSTAEPTPRGIVWTYVKEMEQYNALWNHTQEIVFALPNIVNDVYTGPLKASLTATYFTVPDSPATADKIISISGTRSGPWGTAFSIPDGGPASVSLELPRNVERAVISLSACGQQAEEFWYNNVFSMDTGTFANTTGELYGYSPFREVQLLIDGEVAGFFWPFPIVFTGGIVPGFWRPIVGIDAFDLRQHEIDVTPWLGLLCDGKAHTFEIKVVGLTDDHKLSETVGSFWLVTGTIFLWLDAGSTTTGVAPPSSGVAPTKVDYERVLLMNADTGANESLSYNLTVYRSLSVSSEITTSRGTHQVSWKQILAYSNDNSLDNEGVTQYTTQNTKGEDRSSSGYAYTYSYPITVNSTYMQEGNNISINGTISHSLDFNVSGPSVFPSGIQDFFNSSPDVFSAGGLQAQEHINLANDPIPAFSGATLSTTQSATASYLSAGQNASYSFGSTNQEFDFRGVEGGESNATFELYHRNVTAVNSTITEDEQTLAGHTYAVPVALPGLSPPVSPPAPPALNLSIKAVLGRGPGLTKAQLGGVP